MAEGGAQSDIWVHFGYNKRFDLLQKAVRVKTINYDRLRQ